MRIVFASALVAGFLFLVGSHSLAEATSAITLEQPVHFWGADGSDVVAQAGMYQVERSASQLSLTSQGHAPLLLEATPTPHSETIETPLAVVVRTEDRDVLHVVLLMPKGEALDAPGSLSGTRPRASKLPVVTLSQIQIASVEVTQSPVRRDHRGEPQQMPAPSQPPIGQTFGTPTPGTGSPILAKFRMLELGSYPPKFLTGEPVSSFYLVYQCEVEGRPCNARQDLINVNWTLVYRGSNQPNLMDGIAVLSIPGRVLHGAVDASCEAAIRQKYPNAACFYGVNSGAHKAFAEPGMIFRSIFAVGTETAYTDFLVERTQPSPSLMIGRSQIVDHR